MFFAFALSNMLPVDATKRERELKMCISAEEINVKPKAFVRAAKNYVTCMLQMRSDSVMKPKKN